MDKFADAFLMKGAYKNLQPQIFSLLLVTIILSVLAVVIYFKVKKQQPNKAPDGLLLITEQYVMGIDNLYGEITENKFTKPAPYIFTLFTFLGLSNLMGLIGLEPAATSYSVTIVLALISWVGIYVVGVVYQKVHFLHKFINPLELLGQFSPLISLSFRLFGNLIAGATIMYLLYAFTGWIWGHIPVIGDLNLLGAIVAWPFHVYFDLFDGLVQTFVFVLLTMIYWTLEAEGHGEKKAESHQVEKNVELNKNINAIRA